MPEFYETFPGDFNRLFEFYNVKGTTGARSLVSSSYRLGDLNETEEHEYLPSRMAYDAQYNTLTKATVDRNAFDPELYNQCLAYLEAKFGGFLRKTRVLSFDEAVDRMELRTSAGWPWSYVCRTKEEALAFEWAEVRRISDLMVEGKWNETLLHTATLKDELLPKEKVIGSQPRTRVFMNVSLAYVITGCRLFWEQNDLLHKALFSHPSTIGLELPGRDFAYLFSKMASHDPLHCWDRDAKNFEFGMDASVIMAVRDFRRSHLDGSGKAVINYYNDIYCGYVSINGVVVGIISNKSGHYLTADDNSMINACYMLRAYLLLNPTHTVQDFIRNVLDWANGDDGMTSVKAENCKLHPADAARVLAENRMWIESSSTDYIPFSECIYLSHKIYFRHSDFYGVDVVVAGGNRQKLIDALQFTSSHDDFVNAQRYYALVNNLFAYKEDYEYWLKRVDQWAKSHRYNRICPNLWNRVCAGRLTERELVHVHCGRDW